jgi:hypothetical protein
MPSQPSLRIRCTCARCSKTPQGFVFQTKQAIGRHLQKYGRYIQLRSPPRCQGSGKSSFNSRAPVDDHETLPPSPAHPPSIHGEYEGWGINSDIAYTPALSDDNDDSDTAHVPAYEHGLGLLEQASLSQAANTAGHRIVETFIDVGPPIAVDVVTDFDGSDELLPGIPAMKEKPYIRLTYLQAVLGNVFGKLTWAHATEQLRNTFQILSMAGSLPEFPQPVQTLQSARRRLAIDPDAHIIQYSVCPQCWKHYTPFDMNNLASANCMIAGCPGKVFTINGGNRIATLINPQVSIIASLRRMFLRPGFAQMVARKPDQRPGRNNDNDFVMKDLSDGDMWYQSTVGTTRQIGSQGTIRDIPLGEEDDARKLYSCRFGLQLTLNTDW